MFCKAHWWKVLLGMVVMGGVAVLFMGIQTYQEAPPIPDFVDAEWRVVVSADAIRDGQAVFQKYALMEYGTMFGDGGNRGPDHTAESLHQTAESMNAYYQSQAPAADEDLKAGLRERVKREIKETCTIRNATG